MPAMPRTPNIDIKGQLIRQRRNDLGLSQQELARHVYQLQDKAHIPSRDTLERRCRDWEVNNRISRQTLPALATALNMSVPYLLEGEAPDPSPDRTIQIAERLRNQVVLGAEPAIQFIARVWKLSEIGGIPPLADDAAAYSEAARALECRLGAAQLTSDRAELATLAKLLDWRTADLSKPSAAHPYWLVHVNGKFRERLHLVRGTGSAIQALNDGIAAWCQDFSGEGRAVFVEDGPWFRVHLEEGQDAEFDQDISIVLCEPGEAGLKYTASTEVHRDRIAEAVLPSLQPHFHQVGQLKFISCWAYAEATIWQPVIRDFVGPIQPFWVRGADWRGG